jgi:hypothetical protein
MERVGLLGARQGRGTEGGMTGKESRDEGGVTGNGRRVGMLLNWVNFVGREKRGSNLHE